MTTELQVNRKALHDYRVVSKPEAPLADGEVRLRVEHFAFTANNITYGAAGDRLGYWQFFPARGETGDDEGWGVIPVWGFAEVSESRCAEVPVGDRIYGYLPPASSVVMQPVNVKSGSFTDGVAHRQALPPLYNRYQRVLADPGYTKEGDVARMLLSPLHLTSYCIWDHGKQQGWFSAEQVLIISASSKTSLGVAVALARDPDSPTVVGLPSEANAEFVRDTALYADVVAYPDIAEKISQRPTLIIDMAGNPALRRALQARLGEEIKHYIGVGLTHWEEEARGSREPADSDLVPIASQEMFFAPTYILERMKTLEPGQFERDSSDFLAASVAATFSWMQVEGLRGVESLGDLYPRFVDGTVPPSVGYVVNV